MGAAVVRAYGLEDQTDGAVKRAIDQRYRAEVARALPRGDALAAVVGLLRGGAVDRDRARARPTAPSGGSPSAQVTAFLFLADVFLHVFTDLPEVYSETQTAIAGWRKILAVLDLPVEIVEPVARASSCDAGRCRSRPTRCATRYRTGPEVLHGISLSVPAGGHVAIVGETGCGKTTFVKLMSRLADPVERADPRGRRRPARGRARVAAGARSAWCRRTASCSTPPCARTCGTGARAPRTAT